MCASIPAYINPKMTWYILHDICMHALYIKSHVYAEVKSSSACLPNMGHLMPWRWPSKKRPSRARKTQRKVAGFQPLLSGETRAGHRPSPSCCFQKNGTYTFLQQSTDVFCQLSYLVLTRLPRKFRSQTSIYECKYVM